ncbi:ubiquitin-conjugating enzyme E2 J1-like [Scleropages formosus]|uniref:Ubiquitin-conjugating enzyme E2 J1-like n=1 Tax=Scleropages formosus TaxID=113540 RepID=A0A0P7VYX8_SCLFO|nr:ubiquitin-conjugating enzyme E2 J1-like [Scleropages formosus]
MENKYNLRSPAVKRLMKEAAELRDPTEHYHAQPLEDNLFEWHFSVRGPPDSDFDGGVYHGRIILPPEYPMKPPSIILLTVRSLDPSTLLSLSLIPLFQQLQAPPRIWSQDFCCETCGCSMRTALLTPTSDSKPSQEDREAKELARQINFKAEAEQPPGEQVTLMAPSNRPLSPRQRRAQQNQQPRRAAFHTFPAATRPPPEAGHTGSAVLIVVLTLALAALIFRRIYLASEYKFDYEL